MTTDRRAFMRGGGLGLVAAGLVAVAPGSAAGESPLPVACEPLPRQGPKEIVQGKRAVASSQSPIVTQTMLDVLRGGGNAIDACVAGAITQATVQIDMTNHAGTVSVLYWEERTRKVHHLNSMGTLHPGLSPLRPYPAGLSGVAGDQPMACIPGFIPGMQALHARFGTRPWKSLVEPAIEWAQEGFPVDEFTRAVLEWELAGNTYFPEMRALYAPQGFTPSVGEKLRNPALARTLQSLAQEGPQYFTHGPWAQHFVALANELGWQIRLEDLSANPPRWDEPLRYRHGEHEIVQPPPPERQAVFCALVLGMLRHLDVRALGHYSESADSLYYMGQALRRAEFECGLLHDPLFFEQPVDVWLSEGYLASLATILKRSRPKAGVDLTRHVELTTDPAWLRAFGWSPAGESARQRQPAGSCELSCVDAQGNWVQMMTTLQSGGIPGMVVDGVPMVGSHARFSMNADIAGWLGVPGSRMRSIMSNTMILKGGRPVHSLGSPGNVHCTVPQMISNVLDYGFDPYSAAVLPRMLPMREDYSIEIETRIPQKVVRDLARMGAKASPLPPYDFHMGSYQQAWRDPTTGLLGASTDPRRAGKADGL